MFLTNTPCVFHVETMWNRLFQRLFNVEYTWCVCEVSGQWLVVYLVLYKIPFRILTIGFRNSYKAGPVQSINAFGMFLYLDAYSNDEASLKWINEPVRYGETFFSTGFSVEEFHPSYEKYEGGVTGILI